MKLLKSNKTKGFTLIELFIIIAIIAILAIIAVPKYMSLSYEAKQATAESYADTLASAAAINKNICDTDENPTQCIKDFTSCKDFQKLLGESNVPKGIQIENDGEFSSESGSIVSCKVTYGQEISADFRAIIP